MLTTDQKGAIAESAIVYAAIRRGVGVYRPLVEGGRYDLIFDVGSQLVRVQCKWAPRRGDVVIVHCPSSRRARDGIRHRPCAPSEVDEIAAYCDDLATCYLVPVERFAGHPELCLRTAPCRNNQRQAVNWSDDYSFDARLIALLGP